MICTLVMPKSWSLASESPDWMAVMSWCKAPRSVSCCWNRFPCLDRRDLNSDDVKACINTSWCSLDNVTKNHIRATKAVNKKERKKAFWASFLIRIVAGGPVFAWIGETLFLMMAMPAVSDDGAACIVLQACTVRTACWACASAGGCDSRSICSDCAYAQQRQLPPCSAKRCETNLSFCASLTAYLVASTSRTLLLQQRTPLDTAHMLLSSRHHKVPWCGPPGTSWPQCCHKLTSTKLVVSNICIWLVLS